MGKAPKGSARTSLQTAIKDAAIIVTQDPELANSIRKLVADRLQTVLAQIRAEDPCTNF
jgi:hypothetical protein